jgi:2-isopropylmalate synthase
MIPPAKRKAAARALVEHVRRRGKLLISDTTLRDGEQMPGVNFSPEEKLVIARAVEKAGVHSIDAGFAASSRADFEALRMIAEAAGNLVVMSLSRAVRADIDAAYRALESRPAHRRGVSIFLGTSPLHREHKLRKSQDEILAIIDDAVGYAAEYFRIVAFAPEDASRTEPDFLCRCYQTAISAGATSIAFPDTVGILTPNSAAEFIRVIRKGVPDIGQALLAVHFHNDLGLAVANSLATVAGGADIVQCTVGGLGERAGNAALEEVALALRIHRVQYGRDSEIDLEQLTELCMLVAELSEVAVAPTKPVFGANIFATEAGVHQDGILKNAATYLPYPPELVGHRGGVHVALGKHSGRRALKYRLERLGLALDEIAIERLMGRIKDMRRPSDADDDGTLTMLAREAAAGASHE